MPIRSTSQTVQHPVHLAPDVAVSESNGVHMFWQRLVAAEQVVHGHVLSGRRELRKVWISVHGDVGLVGILICRHIYFLTGSERRRITDVSARQWMRGVFAA